MDRRHAHFGRWRHLWCVSACNRTSSDFCVFALLFIGCILIRTANGGSTTFQDSPVVSPGGAGGGGRVALYFEQLDPTVVLQAAGGRSMRGTAAGLCRACWSLCRVRLYCRCVVVCVFVFVVVRSIVHVSFSSLCV